MTGRYLIVNADDFGQSAGVNRGVLEAHERGVVTSASLMVRSPAAAEAAAYSRRHPELAVGLHIDLGEWACRGGTWVTLYEVVPAGDAGVVDREVARQLEAFRDLVGRAPTHLDSHQHVHLREPARASVRRAARALGVPVRHFCPGIRHCGDFYGQTVAGAPFPEGVAVERLLTILSGLPAGVTELACHPGDGDGPDSMYRAERAREVQVLCDARVPAALAARGVTLCSFASLPAGTRLF
jgi:predicted glycoside hydrolase/deacetylase ChbG (UPF0249 family)